MNIPDPEHLTEIVVAFLTGTSLSVGDGEAVESPSPAYPHLVVTPLGPLSIDGPLSDDQADHGAEWQVTSVGLTMTQAQGGLAAARALVFGGTFPDFTAAGYRRTGNPALVGGRTGRDDADKPSLFYALETYRWQVTPA